MKIENFKISMKSEAKKTNLTELRIKKNGISFAQEIKKSDNSNEIFFEMLNIKLVMALIKMLSQKSHKIELDRLELSSFSMQTEEISFQTKAKIITKNDEFEVNLDVSLTQSFVKYNNLNKRELCDPLVINLDSQMPSLGSSSFKFELDCDGEIDQISTLGKNCGFLALDKNENGIIDDGSELFGVKSGDGFYDLSKFDDDKNGFIDENDKIFNKLRIWLKTDTEDRLISISEVGIGAIYLGRIKNDFELKSNFGEKKGLLNSSGFYLFEDKKAGIISQIDLAKMNQQSIFQQLLSQT